MKITVEFLIQLKSWIESLKESDDYRIPDFMKDEEGARLLIQTFCEKLRKNQGEHLWNGHFTEKSEDEAIKDYLPKVMSVQSAVNG